MAKKPIEKISPVPEPEDENKKNRPVWVDPFKTSNVVEEEVLDEQTSTAVVDEHKTTTEAKAKIKEDEVVEIVVKAPVAPPTCPRCTWNRFLEQQRNTRVKCPNCRTEVRLF